MGINELNYDESAGFLSALANAKRLQIMYILSVDGETSVGSLASQIALSQSALSQHLAKLRQAKLVSTRREAQTIYYSCCHPGVRLLLGSLEHIRPDEPESP